MTMCAKRGEERQKIYNYEHTEYQKYYVECYTELHYCLTE